MQVPYGTSHTVWFPKGSPVRLRDYATDGTDFALCFGKWPHETTIVLDWGSLQQLSVDIDTFIRAKMDEKIPSVVEEEESLKG